MSNMEVGEYIRFSDGSIIKAIEGEISYYEYILEEGHIFKNGVDVSIIKHSKNIIDLIEVGDYVNGDKVCFINNKRILIENNVYLFDKYSSITSIVTKEQFKEMEYRINE